jgi:hypothetical protein
MVHVDSRVLRVPLGLIDLRVFTEHWPEHPRLSKTQSLRDLQPISLLANLYTILTKVLANKLNMVIMSVLIVT